MPHDDLHAKQPNLALIASLNERERERDVREGVKTEGKRENRRSETRRETKWEIESGRRRENKLIKNYTTCYSKLVKVEPYCSVIVKFFSTTILDNARFLWVDAINLQFGGFTTPDVDALMTLIVVLVELLTDLVLAIVFSLITTPSLGKATANYYLLFLCQTTP